MRSGKCWRPGLTGVVVAGMLFWQGCTSVPSYSVGGRPGVIPSAVEEPLFAARPEELEREYNYPTSFLGFRGTALWPTDGAEWDASAAFSVFYRSVVPTASVGTHLFDFSYSYLRYQPEGGGGETECGMLMAAAAKTFYKDYPVYLGGGIGVLWLDHPTLGKDAGFAGEGFLGWQLILGNIDVALEGGYLFSNPGPKMDSVFGRVDCLFSF